MKKIQDYLHFYLGCRVFKKKSTVTNKFPETLTIQLYNWVIGTPKHCTVFPILRPLKDISQDEKDFFQKICHLEKEDLDCLSNGTAHLTNITEWALGVKFLLSRNFDLFGLIESGLAIDSTHLTSPSEVNLKINL